MHSDDGKTPFLEKIPSNNTSSKTSGEKIPVGSSSPKFRSQGNDSQLDVESFSLSESTTVAIKNEVAAEAKSMDLERIRPAIHMDAMAFGMGICCLQVTFQARDVDESRFLYDQLAVLAPIMMALTASTPILKGRLADTDARWGVISESVDCRTAAERGMDVDINDTDMAAKGKRRIYKSRYDSISTFIYQGMADEDESTSNSHLANRVLNMYNDIPVPIDQEKYELLRQNGIDPALSQHIAHLFIRDPLVVFDGAVEEVDNEKQTEHFESIQSTNW